MVKVLVNGARGRMGQEVVRAVGTARDMDLVRETDLGDDLARSIRQSGAEVVVDFTVPDSAVKNTMEILESGARPVVGTTGFRPDDVRELQDRAAELGRGGLIAPNFAIGAVLMMKFAAEAARFLPSVEVIELHHDQKLDAPSGTAVKTVELIRAALDAGDRPEESPAASPDARESIVGVRGGRYLGIPIHSVRLPGLIAHQEVLLGGTGQVLTLRHDTSARTAFMPGVLLAVRKAPLLDRLYYGLEQILDV